MTGIAVANYAPFRSPSKNTHNREKEEKRRGYFFSKSQKWNEFGGIRLTLAMYGYLVLLKQQRNKKFFSCKKRFWVLFNKRFFEPQISALFRTLFLRAVNQILYN